MYTDQLIQELIGCPKQIVSAPKTIDMNLGSSKIEFKMSSIDGKYNFKAFISRNNKFAENFSIGLIYEPKEERGKICILRCNGIHGETVNTPHHSSCHIHTVLAADINNGIRVERHIEKTEAYSTVEDAIQFFLKHINVNASDRQKHFPAPPGGIQLGLYNDSEEPF